MCFCVHLTPPGTSDSKFLQQNIRMTQVLRRAVNHNVTMHIKYCKLLLLCLLQKDYEAFCLLESGP